MNENFNKEQAVQEIEISSDFAQTIIDKGECWSRLLDNPDFKKAVVKGVFEDEVVRITMLLADPEFDTPEKKTELYAQLAGIANFRMMIVQDQRLANQMRETKRRNDETIAELESAEG